MTTPLFYIGTYVLFALWQSTLCLALALLLGWFYSTNRRWSGIFVPFVKFFVSFVVKPINHEGHKEFTKFTKFTKNQPTPSKAHFIYVTGIFAAILTPLFSTIIHIAEGGWLVSASFAALHLRLFEPETTGIACLAGMSVFVILLLYGIASSRRLMFHATPYPDRESQDTLLRHSKMLCNDSQPILFTSKNVKSPTVWCWGLHPAVLLPESLAEKLRDVQRDAVFLHELSHIVRRDHFTSLFTRLCGAVLFWNPLYWLVLWQCDLAADESCDLVVLARSNIKPKQYTDTLLQLVAGERSYPILQFLSRKDRIMKRINQILSAESFSALSAPSRLWSASVFLTAMLLCLTLAFCQDGRRDSSVVTFEQYTIYEVNKKVSDYREGIVSSPEAAYATFSKALASKDVDAIAKLEFANTKPEPGQIDKAVNALHGSDAMKTAEIRKVFIHSDRVAMVIADFAGEQGKQLYDARFFQKKNGQWFGVGIESFDSPDVGMIRFVRLAEKATQPAVRYATNELFDPRSQPQAASAYSTNNRLNPLIPLTSNPQPTVNFTPVAPAAKDPFGGGGETRQAQQIFPAELELLVLAIEISAVEMDEMHSANERVPGTFPQSELRKAELKIRQAQLELERAKQSQNRFAPAAQRDPFSGTTSSNSAPRIPQPDYSAVHEQPNPYGTAPRFSPRAEVPLYQARTVNETWPVPHAVQVPVSAEEIDLLKTMVEIQRAKLAQVKMYYEAGSIKGTPELLAQACADLAAAEVEFYKLTVDRDKMEVAMKQHIAALVQMVDIAKSNNQHGIQPHSAMLEAELQLKRAMLEMERLRSQSGIAPVPAQNAPLRVPTATSPTPAPVSPTPAPQPGRPTAVPMVEIPINESARFVLKRTWEDKTATIRFQVFVQVAKENEARFKQQYQQRASEINDKIRAVVQGANLAEYEDPALTAIKEKAKRAINEALGSPWVQEVLITEFTFVMD